MEDCEQHVALQGSNVLIDLNNGDRLTFARLHPSASIKLGNSRCSLSPLINAPYGSYYELQRGSLTKIAPPQDVLEGSVDALESGTPPLSRDNRSLVDDNTAQKLSARDIERLRQDSAGKDIVDALITNSTTFQHKTAFSQEKYKRKKQKKYAPFFVMRRPSSRRICEAYLLKSPQKIGFLRMDTMALILSLANVGAHAEVLVMDTVGGLLTAAVAERMGGFGSVCSVHWTSKPPTMDIVGLLNLSHSMASRVFRASIWDLLTSLKKGSCTGSINQAGILAEFCKEALSSKCEATEHMEVGDVNAHTEREETACMETGQKAGGESESKSGSEPLVAVETGQKAGGESDSKSGSEPLVAVEDSQSAISSAARYGKSPESEDFRRWAKHGFTSLIVGAPEFEPWSAVQELLPLLASSSPFVIYHRYLQPLAECMHKLQVNKMAVALEIVEPWLREYQVLAARTHPQMQMNANGGFVLTGIKITSA